MYSAHTPTSSPIINCKTWRAKIKTKGRDAADVWRDRCAGYSTPDMTPDEVEAYRADRQLSDEGLAAARAYGFNEYEIASLIDFVLVRERDGYTETIFFERGQFKIEREASR
jgi:hypothetical protein